MEMRRIIIVEMRSRRSRLIICAGAGCLLLAALAIVTSGVVRPFTPKAPQAWSEIRPGDERETVIRILGLPQSSGYPEKIVETWSIDGLLGIRRLVIGYDAEGKVVDIVEGVHWRPTQRYFVVKRQLDGK